MAESSNGGAAFPDIFAAIREALDSEQEKVEAHAERLKVQVDRDKAALQLRLRKACALLDPDYQDPDTPSRGKRSRARATGRKRTSVVKGKEVREQILRYTIEKGDPVSSSELREKLGLSVAVVRNAIRKMLADGTIRRIGSHSDTRYVVRAGSSSSSGNEHKQETTQGLILEALADRGWASPAEVSQLLRLPVVSVEEEAAALIAEEEIRWEHRGELRVYVLTAGD